MSNASEAIRKVILAEGGSKFTNDPDDSGGPTKYGITLATLSEYRGYKCSIDDVKNMSEAEAIAIYKKNYWDKLKGDLLPYSISYTMFNYGVNRGIGNAVKLAQEVLGLAVDGVLGPNTLNAIKGTNLNTFISKYLAGAQEAYRELASRREKDKKYLKGWLNRVQEISDYVGIKPATAAGIGALVLLAGVIFFLIFKGKKL